MREALHQLDLLVLLAEPTTRTLGPFFDENLLILSAALGLTVHELVALSTLVDEVLLFYLGPSLREHWARQKEARQLEKVERVGSASQQLVERTRWAGDKAELDVSLLLGPLLDGGQKYLLFVSPAFEVGIARSKLKEVSKVLGKRADLTAWVDPRGLHFRWNQGKGRLNFHPQPRAMLGNEALVIRLLGTRQEHLSPVAAE